MRITIEKFFIGFVIGFCAIFFAIPAHALEVAMESSAAELCVDEVFAVDLTIDVATDLYGVALDVLYDSTLLEVVDADLGTPEVQPDVVEGPLLSEDGAYATILRAALEDDTPGRLVLGLTRDGQVAGVNLTQKKILLTVYFQTLASGTATIDFDPVRCGLEDSNVGDIPIDTLTGTQVVIYALGDMNRDGEFDIFDLMKLINCILDQGSCACGDLNGDGEYDIFDLMKLINKILAS